MNAYYAVAKDYFRHMEGWHLYPGSRSWLSWAWAVLAVAWIASLFWVMQPISISSLWNWRFVLAIVLEGALLLLTEVIAARKRFALFGASPGKKFNRFELDDLRTEFLCEHLNATPDNFLEIAKEIKDLKASRKEFRQASEMEWSFLLRKLYDPDSKPRVLALFLAGLTIFTALTVKSAELPAIFETLDSQDFLKFLSIILSISAMLFLLFIGLQALVAVLWTAAASWTAKTINTDSNDTALRYLVHDLVLLYRPKRLEGQSESPSSTVSPDAPERTTQRSKELKNGGVMSSVHTEREDISNEPLVLAVPHQKGPLTTPAGRLVERASYKDLFLLALIGLLTSTTYFALAPKGHSLNIENVSIGDAAYFSLVTFTSLGYGELNPQGFGRAVAGALVLMGLVLVALLVGKFASERQQTLLLLLHTSDCQRRINEFSMQLQSAVEDLEVAAEASQLATLKRRSKDLAAGFEAVSNYLVFNANQARLIEFGNESALVALYSELERVQRVCISIHKSKITDQVVARRTLAIANRTAGLINLMKAFHHFAGEKQSYSSMVIKRMRRYLRRKPVLEMSPLAIRVNTIQARMEKEAELLKQWVHSTYTPSTAEALWNISPTGLPASWPKGLHKTLAVKLGISNRLAQKCLDELLHSGRLPKPMKGEAVHSKNVSNLIRLTN